MKSNHNLHCSEIEMDLKNLLRVNLKLGRSLALARIETMGVLLEPPTNPQVFKKSKRVYSRLYWVIEVKD
jgi:hypothetical protein